MADFAKYKVYLKFQMSEYILDYKISEWYFSDSKELKNIQDSYFLCFLRVLPIVRKSC